MNELLAKIRTFRLLRVFYLAAEAFNAHNGFLWASALTYTTFLSIVPIMSLALSAVVGFGGITTLRPLIERYIAAGSPEVTDRILSFVSNIDKRTLGTVGGVGLIITAILTLGTIERAFNCIFGASSERSIHRKFFDYLSIIFAVPLVATTVVALSHRVFRFVPHWQILETVLVGVIGWFAIGSLYAFLPNAKVDLKGAAIGSLITTLILAIAQSGFIYLQYGVSTYRAIYGALAAIPTFMTWIYMNWLILLYGGELTVALQTADGLERLRTRRSKGTCFGLEAALLVMVRAAERMRVRDGSFTLRSAARELGVTPDELEPIVARLKSANLLVESGSNLPDRFDRELFLRCDPNTITLAEIAKLSGEESDAPGCVDRRINSVLRAVACAQQSMLSSVTLRDLLDDNVKTEL